MMTAAPGRLTSDSHTSHHVSKFKYAGVSLCDLEDLGMNLILSAAQRNRHNVLGHWTRTDEFSDLFDFLGTFMRNLWERKALMERVTTKNKATYRRLYMFHLQ